MTRNVLVTGGGTGIGRAVAAAFAADGDAVVITGRRRAPLDATAAELGVRAVVCDAADPAHVEALLGALPEAVDVLVNNAGGNTDFDRDGADDLKSLSEDWHANLEANLLSAVLTTQAVGPRLRGGGTVVHIGSIAADRGNGAYGAAKAALASWNVGLARTLGERSITTNVVSPGYIADTEFFRGRADEAFRRDRVAATATGRMGVPEDMAATIGFLASPGARHITAQVINVNGGEHPTR